MKQRIVASVKSGLCKINVLNLIGLFAVTMMLVTLMTGSLFFTNIAYITDPDNNVSIDHYTLSSDPYTILVEAGVEVGEHDVVTFTEFVDYKTNINIERAFPYTVQVEDKTYTEYTTQSTVDEALKALDITLGEFDTVTPELSHELVADDVIKVERAFPFTLRADGVTYTIHTTGMTVADALAQSEVTLGAEDLITHPLDTAVTEGMQIIITRIGYREEVEVRSIPFKTETQKTNTLTSGVTKTITAGVNGEQTIITRKKYVNGDVYESQVISDTVTKEPVTEVIQVGTAPKQKIVTGKAISTMKPDIPLNLVNGVPTNYTRVISGKSTAYVAPKGARTSTGRLAQLGIVAVNPKVIPYGSKLYIVSQDGKYVYGYGIAGDTGGALRSGRVVADIFVGDTDTGLNVAYQWGARQVNVYVLEEGNGK